MPNASGTPMAIGDSLIAAVLGYAIVFVGLIVLMWVVMIVGKIMYSKSKNGSSAPSSQPAPAPAPVVQAAPAPAPAAPSVPAGQAPGSAGDIKLYDTPPKIAAMVMAIVADEMGKPLNELRFKSIKEVK